MVVSFKEAKELNKVGNKAKFLVEMKKAKFNVPDGIIVDSDTYIEIIKDNKLDKKILNLLKELNKKNTKEISNKIIKLLDKKDVVPFTDVKGQIQQYLTSKKQNEMYSNFTQGLKSKYTVEKA